VGTSICTCHSISTLNANVTGVNSVICVWDAMSGGVVFQPGLVDHE